MKHQAMLINSTECFYLCGGSSIKCVNKEIDKSVAIPKYGYHQLLECRSHTTFT